MIRSIRRGDSTRMSVASLVFRTFGRIGLCTGLLTGCLIACLTSAEVYGQSVARQATKKIANAESRLVKASPPSAWHTVKGPLSTRWDSAVSPTNALPDYPRPQMVRSAWLNLNGLWDYGTTDKDAAAAPSAYSGKILVPYPFESALSGVKKASIPTKRLWYRRNFTVPAAWKNQHVLLHFDAVNWDSAVILNGKPIGQHRGGYDGFSFDITNALQSGGNELVVNAWNPILADDPDAQVLGKQRIRPGGIFYTAATGIWQTVWMEPVPAGHISSLKITPDLDAKLLRVKVNAEGVSDDAKVEATVFDGSTPVSKKIVAAADVAEIPVENPHPWTPADPHLYSLKVALVKDGKPVDSVDSYFAMRKVSLGPDEQGRLRMMLNNKFVFQIGLLDQGYWPDGIYTAPTDKALRYDIEIAKKLGYNLLRKHAKVEPERWYYWTDKLGMLVWQDMPQCFGGKNNLLSTESKEQFETELRNHNCCKYRQVSAFAGDP